MKNILFVFLLIAATGYSQTDQDIRKRLDSNMIVFNNHVELLCDSLVKTQSCHVYTIQVSNDFKNWQWYETWMSGEYCDWKPKYYRKKWNDDLAIKYTTWWIKKHHQFKYVEFVIDL